MLWLLAAMGKAEGCVARGEWRGHATALSVAPAFRRLGWAAKSMERLEEISEKWDRADSLARFVLPHPTGRRGLSGLQRAPTCRLGTPSAPLLRSGGKVRNNREEIEEKEKRGRVTLQAALLAALREDQEKGRENTGVQAPKASLHSRNCMGISVSSVSRGRKRLLEAEAMKQSP
ncbi:hypothetical protein QYF61_002985 [Mycteria americana]|uniref:Uncharacterized protein n=1 Tax=Mycteria americana TaxID=33587 RepID=A0AAN7NER1_MYCAM|nr:hypothetical protein QYF61_002985 [Mycteria americana]